VFDLREAWGDLLRRRAGLAPSLGPYGAVVERWARWAGPALTPSWSADDCRAAWARGEPVLAAAAVTWPVAAVESLVGPALDDLARLRPDAVPDLRRIAEAWDAGRIGPGALRPDGGAWVLAGRAGLATELVALLAHLTLPPVLEPAGSRCRELLRDEDWGLGLCPCCGGPPGLASIVETGQRRLACQLCAGEWAFSRLRCPFCGCDESGALVRLAAEGSEEGYAVAACAPCRGYLKEVDRRARWNAGPPMVEDWGTPHLDLIALRAGYRRPLPSLVQLVLDAPGEPSRRS